MLPALVLVPFLGALLTPLLVRHLRWNPAPVAAGVVGFALLMLLSQAGGVFDDRTLIEQWPWAPRLGLNAAFRLDGLGLLFGLLILVIGLLVVLYARYYLTAEDAGARFYAFLLIFMGAMLGLVLSENLLQLAMFWELTSLSSFLLIGYWKHQPEARRGARLALVITGGGGLAMLAAVLLIGHIVGSFELFDVFASGRRIANHPLYIPLLVLLLIGVFTKSAQFPFHFWLPSAMAAPTPVSAYLHSATMVKAGIFILARLYPVLGATEPWFYLVGITGLITLLMGAYHALWQHDLKGLLAYSTISHLGLITLLLGLGTPLAEVAAVFHIINHAVFKASLFMAAGIIDHEAGTRDMRRLNGLFKYMPYTAVLAMVAAGAMAGVPLLNGFLSKEMFFGEAVEALDIGPARFLLPLTAVLAGVGSVAYSLRFIHDVFFNGEPVDLPRTPHEPPKWMKFPVELLVALCLAVGIVPAWVIGPLLDVAARAVLQAPLPDYTLAAWHGFSIPLLMSALALGGGVVVYAFREPLFRFHDRVVPDISARRAAEGVIRAAYAIAATLNRGVENGSLQRYTAILVASAVVVGTVGFAGGALTGSRPLSLPDLPTITICAILVIGAAATAVVHRQRLLAVIALGSVGLMVALLFVRFSGPDLAMTQLLVEFVTIVLVLLALFFLPPSGPRESGGVRRGRDLGLATLAGAGAAGLTWALLTRPFDSVSAFYLAESLPGGGGANVVNVILVDFRGFDTLGEISVLGIAAVGIVAMMDRLALAVPAADSEGRRWSDERHPVMLAVVSRVILPFALVVSLYLLLRGHNAPGGGFIAGLVTATAVILQYIANGSSWVRARMPTEWLGLIGGGVIVATMTGIASWAYRRPFLTTWFDHLHWPVVGDFEVASALVFDLGVYLAVVGTVLLILARLGRLNEPPDPGLEIRTAGGGG